MMEPGDIAEVCSALAELTVERGDAFPCFSTMLIVKWRPSFILTVRQHCIKCTIQPLSALRKLQSKPRCRWTRRKALSLSTQSYYFWESLYSSFLNFLRRFYFLEQFRFTAKLKGGCREFSFTPAHTHAQTSPILTPSTIVVLLLK